MLKIFVRKSTWCVEINLVIFKSRSRERSYIRDKFSFVVRKPAFTAALSMSILNVLCMKTNTENAV